MENTSESRPKDKEFPSANDGNSSFFLNELSSCRFRSATIAIHMPMGPMVACNGLIKLFLQKRTQKYMVDGFGF